MLKRALARLPVVIPIWFLAIVFPFFGPINSTVGSLLVSFTVYIIPSLAHMVTFSSASAREVRHIKDLSIHLYHAVSFCSHSLNQVTDIIFVWFFTECCGQTTPISWRLGGLVLCELFCGGMGFCCGIWIWRMGEHAQLYTSD